MDEFDQQVMGLFPCCEDYRLVKCHSLVCPGDQYHKAVAAALRGQGKTIADLRAEVERLKESTSVVLISRLRNQYDEIVAERDQLQAQLAHGQLYDCDRCGSRMRLAMEKKP